MWKLPSTNTDVAVFFQTLARTVKLVSKIEVTDGIFYNIIWKPLEVRLQMANL